MGGVACVFHHEAQQGGGGGFAVGAGKGCKAAGEIAISQLQFADDGDSQLFGASYHRSVDGNSGADDHFRNVRKYAVTRTPFDVRVVCDGLQIFGELFFAFLIRKSYFDSVVQQQTGGSHAAFGHADYQSTHMDPSLLIRYRG